MKKFLAISAVILLSACNAGWNLNSLKSQNLQGSDYAKFLAREYLDYSQSEADQYDWQSSSYFADKGLSAASGTEVEPEIPSNWDIKNPFLSALDDARKSLIEVINEENKTKNPELLARAQARFDCWVEQQRENWQTDNINACKEDFFSTIEKLKKTSEEKPAAKQEKPEDKNKDIKAIYQVYFNLDSANINKKAKEIIKKIKSDVGDKISEIEVISSGYADKSGGEAYNLKLSKKRAEQVKNSLVKSGFTRDKITVFAFGESDAAVETADGKAEAKNRRVEIIVK